MSKEIDKEYNSRECPKCHSIKSRIMLRFGKYSCMDCGYTWKKEIDKSEWKTENPKLFEYDSNNGNGIVDIFVKEDPACPFPFHKDDWYHQGFYLLNFITYLKDFFKRSKLPYKITKIVELDDYLK